jgi:hypothetical protein
MQGVMVGINNAIAGSFYGFSTILLPYGLSQDKLNSLLSRTSADHVIAEAGTLDLDSMQAANKGLKNIIWVTQPGSQHMDWSEDAPSGFTINSWQGLVENNQRSTNSEVLPLDKDSKVPPTSIFYATPAGAYDLVKYTSEVSSPIPIIGSYIPVSSPSDPFRTFSPALLHSWQPLPEHISSLRPTMSSRR